MILINLLPHREEKRKRRKQAFFAGLFLSSLIGAGLAGLGYLALMEMMDTQQSRNEFLQSEIRRLEMQIKDIASLKGEIEALKARQKVVEDFQIDRNMPVHMLNELAARTPEGVYLSMVKQEGQAVLVSGIAQSNERVSEFLRNTAYNSAWLERPELVEIKVTPTMPGARDQKRLFDFSVRLTLKRPQDLGIPGISSGAGGAAVPARAASAS
jgi:type IV pilus assembly protein PilN